MSCSRSTGANVIVLEDINDFEFSETVEILEEASSTLMDTLPKAERYSYVFGQLAGARPDPREREPARQLRHRVRPDCT